MAHSARSACALLAWLAWLAAAASHAGDMCPAPPKHSKPTAVALGIHDHLIHIESDEFTANMIQENAVANGRVRVSQDNRSLSADTMTYDYRTGKATVKGSVDFEDPKIGVKGDAGVYDALGAAEFDQAYFRIFDRNGRGFARQMSVQPDGLVELDQVRYTTCPVGNEDWMLQASSITMDTNAQAGVARGVLMRFKNVPFLYTPYISFPLGDERKSGLLFPSFGHSSSNGYQFEVPYYFNLAPNYDLTLTPGYLSARGVQLGEEFRFLSASSHGVIEGNFLPDDRLEHGNRTFVHVGDVTDLEHGLRFDTDLTSVSDVNYFSDFAVGSEQTSVTFLERHAAVQYYDDHWRIRGEVQNFQTIDDLLYDYERPYSSVPRIDAEGLWPIGAGKLEFAVNGGFNYFLRKNIGDVFTTNPVSGALDALPTPTGARFDVSPELRWSAHAAGYFFEPAVGYHFTQYALQNPGANLAGEPLPSAPTRTLPYARVDTGLVFERMAGASGQRTQTLEPRLVYSYAPYRNQDELPVFDTALPDLNLTELFRTNRFVGGDRISDADQLALGLTTRLFDTVSGTEYLSATLGQIRYISVPRVGLPEVPLLLTDGQMATLPQGIGLGLPNPLATPQLLTPASFGTALLLRPGQPYVTSSGQLAVYQPGEVAALTERYPASDLVGDIALTAYKHVSLNLAYQWNPYTQHTDKEEIGVQYHPDALRVINLSYRLQTGILKQYDASVVWPIAGHWNTIGRWVYSLQDRETIEQVAGIEYKSCCYGIQIVQRRYLQRVQDGTAANLSTSIALQLELTGLSSVGKAADSYLSKEIPGYPVSTKAGELINPDVP